MKTALWFGSGLLGLLFGSLFGSLFCAAADQVTVTQPGEAVRLTCGVDSYTSSLEWKHGDEMIYHVEKKRFPRKGTDDTAKRSYVSDTWLTIRDVKEVDAGQFTCKADGTTHGQTLLVVSVSASPSDDFLLGSEVTLQCEVKGQDPEPAVQWLRPDGSPHTGSETVQLKSASDSGTWKCTFSHGGVTYSEDLHIEVKEPEPTTPAPRPRHGPEDPSKPTCITCGCEGPSKRPAGAGLQLELSWCLWVVTGAAAWFWFC